MEQQIGGMTLTAMLLTLVGVALVVEAALATATRWCGRRIGAAWHRLGRHPRRGNEPVFARAWVGAADQFPCRFSSNGRARSVFARGGPTPARLRRPPAAGWGA